jgi:hypothetical protein
MNLRTVRAGFLLLASLMVGNLPAPEPSPVLPSPTDWERFSDRCASDKLRALEAAEAPSDSDWNHVDERHYGLRQLYEMTGQTSPASPK